MCYLLIYRILYRVYCILIIIYLVWGLLHTLVLAVNYSLHIYYMYKVFWCLIIQRFISFRISFWSIVWHIKYGTSYSRSENINKVFKFYFEISKRKTNKQEKDYHHCPSLWTISSLSKCMDQMGSRPPPLAKNIRFMFRLNRSSRVLHVTTMYRILARFTRPYTCIIFLFFFSFSLAFQGIN